MSLTDGLCRALSSLPFLSLVRGGGESGPACERSAQAVCPLTDLAPGHVGEQSADRGTSNWTWLR